MTSPERTSPTRQVHHWLRQGAVAFVPGPSSPLLDDFVINLAAALARRGHRVLPQPHDRPDVLITTAAFGVPLHWKETLTLTAKRRFGLEKAPLVFHLLHATRMQFTGTLAYFERALAKETP
ncbi:MAG TPA: hypothetical protein VLH85_07040, partial [Levilinea sp.]|nr:hypothetical protein [Levilinea sp.]